MEIVSFEIAKKLKEKGFNWNCVSFYALENFIAEYVDDCGDCYEVDFEIEDLYLNHPLRYKKYETKCLPAPTISQVLKWLRENHKLHISTKPYPCEDGLRWMYEVRKFSSVLVCVVVNKTGFHEPEQAAIAGIEYVIDNLI